MPVVPEVLEPVAYAIPLQLLAYLTATLKGTDVDKPRNLAKSVTVEWDYLSKKYILVREIATFEKYDGRGQIIIGRGHQIS